MKRLFTLAIAGALVLGALASMPLSHTQEGTTQIVDGFYLEEGDTLTMYPLGKWKITSSPGDAVNRWFE